MSPKTSRYSRKRRARRIERSGLIGGDAEWLQTIVKSFLFRV